MPFFSRLKAAFKKSATNSAYALAAGVAVFIFLLTSCGREEAEKPDLPQAEGSGRVLDLAVRDEPSQQDPASTQETTIPIEPGRFVTTRSAILEGEL